MTEDDKEKWIGVDSFCQLSDDDMRAALENLRGVEKLVTENIQDKERQIAQKKEELQEAEDTSHSILTSPSWCSLNHLREKCDSAQTTFARHKYARDQLRKEIANTAHHIRVLVGHLMQVADDIKRKRKDLNEKGRGKKGYLEKLCQGSHLGGNPLSPSPQSEKWYEEELPSLGCPEEEDCDELVSEPEPVSMDDSSFNVLMWRYKQRAKNLMINKTLRNPTPPWIAEMKDVLRYEVVSRSPSPSSSPPGEKNSLSHSAPQLNRDRDKNDDQEPQQPQRSHASLLYRKKLNNLNLQKSMQILVKQNTHTSVNTKSTSHHNSTSTRFSDVRRSSASPSIRSPRSLITVDYLPTMTRECPKTQTSVGKEGRCRGSPKSGSRGSARASPQASNRASPVVSQRGSPRNRLPQLVSGDSRRQ